MGMGHAAVGVHVFLEHDRRATGCPPCTAPSTSTVPPQVRHMPPTGPSHNAASVNPDTPHPFSLFLRPELGPRWPFSATPLPSMHVPPMLPHVTAKCYPTFPHTSRPLVAALRHPYAIDCPASYAAKLPPKSDLFDKGYVLLAAWRGQVQAAKNK